MLKVIGGNSFQVYVSICLLCQVLRSLRAPKREKNGHRKQLPGFAVDKLTRYVDAAVQSSEALLGRKVMWLVSLNILHGLYMGFIFLKKTTSQVGNPWQQE